MNPEYQSLVTLGTNDRFELLRGRRALTGASVLLKRPRRDPAPPADLAALRRELAIAAGLSSAATLLPRMVEAPSPALVMEDPGGELLATSLVSPERLPLEAVLTIGAQLAQVLSDMHRRGVVHNGIRPDVVLWSAVTRRAWLVDLGDAGRSAASPAPSAMPARLVYMSPEQTGRMERSTDARSDLYALGILLYEMLTGAPPFRSGDALEQIHWHIAGVPREPARVDPAIPHVLSDLVMKLLAKTPEERYQSAGGLAQDLAVCDGEWAAHRRIGPFALGRRDVGEHLAISSRLYGREREVHALLDAFDEAYQGRGAGTLLLVEGYSGIGKTSLIQQLYRPIVRQRGYFISGKFDQVVRGVPFGALIQAFRGLVRQWLTESEARLARWRETLTAALGVNAGVLAEVIPEIEFILGPQTAPAALGSAEAQNRFQRVLQNFLVALAQPGHPLVLFLDDLQWADAATLGLLEPLLTSPDIRHLMLMGAYRDNELDASPRLTRTLAALGTAGVTLKRVPLGPLRLPDLTRMVADTLHCETARAGPLAELVHQKTGGNPFFVIQFLKLLEREGQLRFDDDEACWVYRIEQIADAPHADNVIDLMTRSIQRLPPKAQYALTMAACLGNRFDRQTLAIVSEQSASATADDLEQAIAEGLIVHAARPFDEGSTSATDENASFAFLHDRVQQAAYGLIPAERREMVHLAVGRLLRSRATPEQLEAGLFDIVHHLNLGRGLIQSTDERRAVAVLDLAAGRRAKSSTAHDTARELFEAGLGLLDASAWTQDYELCFDLSLEAAETQYLCGRFEAALDRVAELIGRAATPIDRARVMRLRSVQYENMARYGDSLASAREALRLFGVTLPDAEPDKAAALECEIAAIESLRGGREIAALVDLPRMVDPQIRMGMTMLTDSWSAAYILGDPTLARLISATLVRLSLAHGNVEESAYGYVTHAITVGPVRGDYQAADAFGRLALAVNQRFDDARLRAKIYQQFHAHVNLWCQPMRSCMAYAREACRSGLDSGDFLYAAYGAATEPWSAMVAIQDLAQFVRDYTPSVALIEKLKNTGFADSVRVILNWARALQGRTVAPLSLTDATLDEDAHVRSYRDNPFFACIHAVIREQLCALLGNPAQALEAAEHAAGLVHHVPGTVWPVVHEFWHGLALAANIETAPQELRGPWLAEIRQAQAAFQTRALHCAENFLCQAHLLAAELARIEGRGREAIECYEQAIEFAAIHPLVQYHALAHELCGRFRFQRGERQIADMHLAQACERYAQWGATAKVLALEREYPALAKRHAVEPPDPAAPDEARPDDADGLDLFSVLKATQAIAGEAQLSGLLDRLMHIAIESAGAERGALVLEIGAGPLVYEADATTDTPLGAADGVPLERCDSVPAGIVNYVRRTAEDVVLAQASEDEQYGTDPYVVRHRPRSLACVPLHKQGQPIGVLYLEHRRAAAVFTPQRLRTLRILATQAAISLENVRLRENLEAENSYLRRDMIANVSHDLRTPLVSMRGYLELLATKGDTLAPEQRRQYLGIAVRQSEHLATLIDELFELAKLDFKGMTLAREPFAFAELAADVAQKFQLSAQSKQIALRVEAPPRVPLVDADLSLMERVLENLIANALQHTPAGGQVCVRVQADERLRVQVSDTGSGIASAELPFVFDRFYRGAQSRTRTSGGAGLGLAITKRILELHDGDIRAESDAKTGTCFNFSLPLQGPPKS